MNKILLKKFTVLISTSSICEQRYMYTDILGSWDEERHELIMMYDYFVVDLGRRTWCTMSLWCVLETYHIECIKASSVLKNYRFMLIVYAVKV